MCVVVGGGGGAVIAHSRSTHAMDSAHPQRPTCSVVSVVICSPQTQSSARPRLSTPDSQPVGVYIA